MNKKGNKHTKRLTPQSHYRASIVFYELEQGIKPEWVTWEVPSQHMDILRMFVVEGLNNYEISRTGLIISKRGKAMSEGMIGKWVHRYLPFIEYEERRGKYKRRGDKNDRNEFDRLKKLIPKVKCAYCGSKDDLELDHIKPYYIGGKSEIDNLQWLCHDCHKKKTKEETILYGWFEV